MASPDTKSRLLDAAQGLVQARGFNAFSYKDLEGAVGIRTASIHYHFQAKEDLGQALMQRYLSELEAALESIEARARTARGALQAFIGLYRETESRGSICVCGSLAADVETLPPRVQELVDRYLQLSQDWVARTLQRGERAGEFQILGSRKDAAATLVAGLQGGLVLARAQSTAVLARVERSFFSLLPSGA